MPDEFLPIFEGLQRAGDRLADAAAAMVDGIQAMRAANAELARTTAAASHARDEQDDLRESVRRLEGLVQELLRRQ